MAQEVGVRSIPELKQFGHDVKNLSEQLITAFHVTEQKMNAVCEGWNDQINIKFMEEFQQYTKEIEKISSQMNNYAHFIDKSCDILEMYQQNRF